MFPREKVTMMSFLVWQVFFSFVTAIGWSNVSIKYLKEGKPCKLTYRNGYIHSNSNVSKKESNHDVLLGLKRWHLISTLNPGPHIHVPPVLSNHRGRCLGHLLYTAFRGQGVDRVFWNTKGRFQNTPELFLGHPTGNQAKMGESVSLSHLSHRVCYTPLQLTSTLVV